MSTQLITITESGMCFGPFERSRCFHIEKSKVYGTIRNYGVKMVEFLLLRTNDNTISNKILEIWIVEAKSTPPRDDNEIGAIRDKLINALSLGLASALERHPQFKSELPSAFTEISLSQVQVKFALVMRDHPESDLEQLEETLEKELRPTIRTWDFGPNSVAVLNEALARENGLIDATP
ncbi:MAG: hypothetical protein TE42_03560 [Candidatus Synechococcus spongiarum SP3]|uniref:Uncharacterized protein n=1 Tax=Candidatus Synechococcus spongiarum SP3 TaxID=1604020 RepID=A0A0G2HMU5_9SYNE|nr:MAG: hypothetical protein TE42_03560 [Candidatus Synechococcus spongiarum SP3]